MPQLVFEPSDVAKPFARISPSVGFYKFSHVLAQVPMRPFYDTFFAEDIQRNKLEIQTEYLLTKQTYQAIPYYAAPLSNIGPCPHTYFFIIG